MDFYGESVKDLKQRHRRTVERMRKLADISNERKLTPAERDEYDKLSRDEKGIYGSIKARKLSDKNANRGKKFPKGEDHEKLSPKQSFVEWHEARGDYEARDVPKDYDWNSYWAQRVKLQKPGAELRNDPFETRAGVLGLGEDTPAGQAGSGLNIVGQLWGHQVVDLIRAKTFLMQLGATTMPMTGEIYNLPLWAADVQPAFIAEQNGLNLDITPQVGVIQFAVGTWADVTGASLAVIEDAINNGGVNGLIQNSIAKKYARVIDNVAIYGQTGAPSNCAPGLVNETGLLTQSMGTNGAAPTTYADVSKAAALIRGQSAEPNGIVSHPGTLAEYAQLKDTLNQPMRKTPDIAGLTWLDSALLNFQNETQGTSNVTSSLYIADWSYVTIGIRAQGVFMLDQRYADSLMVGWLSRLRMSIRTVYANKTACRLTGIL